MAISRAAVFAAASTATSGSTVTPSYPAGIAAGWLLTLVVLSKRGVTISTPAGWTLDPNAEQSGGNGADGANSGTVKATVFYKVATGSESGTETVSFSGGTTNVVYGRMGAYQNATGAWIIGVANGVDSTAGTALSFTYGTDPGITTDDFILVIVGLNSSGPTSASQALSVSGVTFGALVEQLDSSIASGDTMRLNVCEIPVTSGTSSGVGTFTGTASTSGATSPAGPSILLRMRETAAVGTGVGLDRRRRTMAGEAPGTHHPWILPWQA